MNNNYLIKNLFYIGGTLNGDFIHFLGLIRYLTKYYEKIHFYIEPDNEHTNYINTVQYLYNDILDKIIFFSRLPIRYIKKNAKKNDHTIILAGCRYRTSDFSNIVILNFNTKHYHLNIDNEYNNIFNFNTDEENKSHEKIPGTHLDLYNSIGLNYNIAYKYFYIKRDLEMEDTIYKDILLKNKIIDNKYSIICNDGKIKMKYLNDNKIYIDIHYITPIPYHLIKLFENAEELHLIENSNTLFIYHLYNSGMVKIKNVKIHFYTRNRVYANNYLYPKINEWEYLYD